LFSLTKRDNKKKKEKKKKKKVFGKRAQRKTHIKGAKEMSEQAGSANNQDQDLEQSLT
jgi:hypothetical protein